MIWDWEEKEEEKEEGGRRGGEGRGGGDFSELELRKEDRLQGKTP